jgi:hypothetical protein
MEGHKLRHGSILDNDEEEDSISLEGKKLLPQPHKAEQFF